MITQFIRYDKRGFFFTLMVIAIISIFFISYEIYSITRENSLKQRIATMDAFLSSIEDNLDRQIYTIGFRTLFEIQNDITAQGDYSYEIDERFSEAFINGTLYGTPRNLFLGATYPDILQEMNLFAKKINVNITFTQPVIHVYQEEPWNVIVNMSFNLTLQDYHNLARWDRSETLKVPISIEGFEDPLYIVQTGGVVANKITKTLFEGNYVSGSDVSNLTFHTIYSLYKHSDTAPSFLDRLQGINIASPYGIESLVNLQKLSSQGVAVKNKTVVDYLYFSTSTTTDYHVSGMPSWFLIDQGHAERYQVGNLTY